MSNKYLLLTVDVEALPKRATDEHVKKLMWGEHSGGRAGVQEISNIGREFNVSHVFFVDYCGAFDRRNEIDEVVRWLVSAGEDVQLHTHSEYLPESFWKATGFKYRPRLLNQCNQDKARFVLKYFGEMLERAKGSPVTAFRAGSFRWNADTIRAMADVGIPLSFNNSTHACLEEKNPYSLPTNAPFLWDNGVIEVPVTEKKIFSFLKDDWWARFQFPFTEYFARPINRLFYPLGPSGKDGLKVLLMHSWSLLYWNDQGHAEYRDDARFEAYRKLLKQLTKQFDVITTSEFLDLYKAGRFGQLGHVDLNLANYVRK